MTAPDILPILASPVIGSFLGVVVARVDVPSSIIIGRSRCSSCMTQLRPADLIPVLSWIMSNGRCRHCKARLSALYPTVEVAALGLAIWAATLTSGSALWAGCVLAWFLLALGSIDVDRLILPDFLTLPLILAGLIATSLLWPESLSGAMIGAVAGYASIWFLRWAHQKLTGREGIGLGDAKLLAAAGAWVTWEGLPSVVLVASVLALAAVVIKAIWTGTVSRAERVPFGAFLCAALWLVWLYGPVPFWF